MRTPNCMHFDFAFDAFEGARKIYCAVHGVCAAGVCQRCKDRAKPAAATADNGHPTAETSEQSEQSNNLNNPNNEKQP